MPKGKCQKLHADEGSDSSDGKDDDIGASGGVWFLIHDGLGCMATTSEIASMMVKDNGLEGDAS